MARPPRVASAGTWWLLRLRPRTLSGGWLHPWAGEIAHNGEVPPGQPAGLLPPAPPGWGAPGEQDPTLGKMSVPHTIPPRRGLCCPGSSQSSLEPVLAGGGSNPSWAERTGAVAGIPPGR